LDKEILNPFAKVIFFLQNCKKKVKKELITKYFLVIPDTYIFMVIQVLLQYYFLRYSIHINTFECVRIQIKIRKAAKIYGLF